MEGEIGQTRDVQEIVFEDREDSAEKEDIPKDLSPIEKPQKDSPSIPEVESDSDQ